ncbi:MAG TPA: hypothetical protein VFY03_08785 [Woeseiaceae bacterium]|nr:hypothetical protein [Woeseiaceae bacterium]
MAAKDLVAGDRIERRNEFVETLGARAAAPHERAQHVGKPRSPRLEFVLDREEEGGAAPVQCREVASRPEYRRGLDEGEVRQVENRGRAADPLRVPGARLGRREYPGRLHRLVLHVAREALREPGMAPAEIRQQQVAEFVPCGPVRQQLRSRIRRVHVDVHALAAGADRVRPGHR